MAIYNKHITNFFIRNQFISSVIQDPQKFKKLLQLQEKSLGTSTPGDHCQDQSEDEPKQHETDIFLTLKHLFVLIPIMCYTHAFLCFQCNSIGKANRLLINF